MLIYVHRFIEFITQPFFILLAYFTRKPIPILVNPILQTSATILAKKIRDGELTSLEVVTAYINRCQEVNPMVNAITENRFEKALEDAQNVDDFISRKEMTASELEQKKPLLGIPITIKESCSVKDMIFALGVSKHKKRKATKTGEAADLLLNAGAILIAITSTPPFSLWIETFNSIIGFTSNPYDIGKSSGGSTGGEAALIASAGSVLGLGSDGGGSNRIPAAFCGIFAHKSSNNLVSPKGHVLFVTNQELVDMLSVGPLCRYACDLELAMNVLSNKKFENSCPNITDMKEINIFYMLEFNNCCLSTDRSIKSKIYETVKFFREEKGCAVKKLQIPEVENILNLTCTNFLRVCSLGMADNKTESPSCTYKVCNKIVHFMLTSSLKHLWHTDSTEVYLEKKSDLYKKLLNTLKNNGVILMPTWPESAFYKYQSVLKKFQACYNIFVNYLDLPATAVPVGFDGKNMPISLQVIAAPGQDKLCIMVAKELEKLFGGWVPPHKVKSM